MIKALGITWVLVMCSCLTSTLVKTLPIYQKGDVTPSGYRDPVTELDVGESWQGSHGTGTGDLQTSWGASPQFSLRRGQPGLRGAGYLWEQPSPE